MTGESTPADIAPPDTVSRTRHRIGLMMFVLPILIAFEAMP
jgi:hypothetical protein